MGSSEKTSECQKSSKRGPLGLEKRFTQTDYFKKTQGETFGETEGFSQTVAECRK